MARGYSSFGRRRSGLSPRIIAILAGAALIVLVGAVFWLSSQAESRKPEQVEIRVEATNVAPQ